jgi:putative nucleotidyltransferase with HDIG domain
LRRTESAVRRMFPELKSIKNGKLRDQVVRVWEDAIRLGGWKPKDVEKVPFTLLIPKTRVKLIDHTRAVTQTAVAIAGSLKKNYGAGIKIDMDVLVAGALLHDVGKLLEYKKAGRGYVKSRLGSLLRHPFSGQALSYKHGVPPEILHMIAYHSKEGDLGKRSVEAIIIHHADFVNFEPLKG